MQEKQNMDNEKKIKLVVCFRALAALCLVVVGICGFVVAAKMDEGGFRNLLERQKTANIMNIFSIAQLALSIIAGAVGLLLKVLNSKEAAECFVLGGILFLIQIMGIFEQDVLVLGIFIAILFLYAAGLTIYHCYLLLKKNNIK